MDGETERERLLIVLKQKKVMDQEIPTLRKCLELAPPEYGPEDD